MSSGRVMQWWLIGARCGSACRVLVLDAAGMPSPSHKEWNPSGGFGDSPILGLLSVIGRLFSAGNWKLKGVRDTGNPFCILFTKPHVPVQSCLFVKERMASLTFNIVTVLTSGSSVLKGAFRSGTSPGQALLKYILQNTSGSLR